MKQKIADAKKKTTEESSRQQVIVGDKIGVIDPAKIVYDLGTRQHLVRDVKRTIEIGLHVSNWGKQEIQEEDRCKTRAIARLLWNEMDARSSGA